MLWILGTSTKFSHKKLLLTLTLMVPCFPKPCNNNSLVGRTTVLWLGWATQEAALKILHLWAAFETKDRRPFFLRNEISDRIEICNESGQHYRALHQMTCLMDEAVHSLHSSELHQRGRGMSLVSRVQQPLFHGNGMDGCLPNAVR